MMIKKLITDEYLYEEKLINGLTVYLHPKPNFNQTYVSLQVNFGGRDFLYECNNKTWQLPEGTAHFLEHMNFENNNERLSDFFIKNNADINASTSRTTTSYYFSTRTDVEILLSKLLNNFINYNFSEEMISKERKIIAEELAMSDDSFQEKAHRNLLKMMYEDSSIYSDIGGTKKSIKAIDQSVLIQAVNHFYHPKNMTLLISGSFDYDSIIAVLNNHPFTLFNWPEYHEVKRSVKTGDKRPKTSIKKAKELNTNIVEIGLRFPKDLIKDNKSKLYIINKAFQSLIFSNTSKLYKLLKMKNLYNFTFQAANLIEDEYGYFNVSIETKKPQLFIKTVNNYFSSISENDFSLEKFIAFKRSEIGYLIKIFDDVKATHNFLKRLIIKNIDIVEYIETLKEISLEDLSIFLDVFKKENIFYFQYLLES
jgi:predicted Zn-dependent peptidase